MLTQIAIVHTPGCPHAGLARQRVQAAIAELGGPAPAIVVEEIADPDAAVRRDFRGSPALIADGIDLFAAPGGIPGFACRTYATDAGIEGAPSVRQIVEALRSAQGS